MAIGTQDSSSLDAKGSFFPLFRCRPLPFRSIRLKGRLLDLSMGQFSGIRFIPNSQTGLKNSCLSKEFSVMYLSTRGDPWCLHHRFVDNRSSNIYIIRAKSLDSVSKTSSFDESSSRPSVMVCLKHQEAPLV